MKGLIIDDDPLVVQSVEHFTEKSELLETCDHAGDVATALNRLGRTRFRYRAARPALAGRARAIGVGVDPRGDRGHRGVIGCRFGAASYGYPNIVDYLVKPVEYERFGPGGKKGGRFPRRGRAKWGSHRRRGPAAAGSPRAGDFREVGQRGRADRARRYPIREGPRRTTSVSTRMASNGRPWYWLR